MTQTDIRDARIYEQTAYDAEERSCISHGISMTACNIADVLAEDNPRFDRARFLKACKA